MPDAEWNREMIFRAYEMARSGATLNKICNTIGISRQTVRTWRIRGERKTFFAAIDYARKMRDSSSTGKFLNYVYKQLPGELQALWEEIVNIHEDQTVTKKFDKIEALLRKKGKRARQHLFIHSWVMSNFNASEACRKVNISRATFQNWMEEANFRDLIDEVHFHKKNFVEGGLMSLIEQGDTSATIFANRTLNRDRGYNEKVEVEHTHQHSIATFNVEQVLDRVNAAAKREILQAIRDIKGEKALPAIAGQSAEDETGEVIDAEIVSEEEQL